MQNALSFAVAISGLLCFATVAQAQVPGAPTGFESHPTGNSGTPPINLTWDPTPGATSYIVYRSTTQNSEAQYATSTTNSYLDSSVAKGPPTVYYYKLAAVNASGTGPESAESASPTPLPVSSGDGMQAGISLGGGAYRWNCEYALLGNFDWFVARNGWFPENLKSTGAISPGNLVVDMAYASRGTMSFLNVDVPASGLYNIDWSYTFASGAFPGVTNREMSLLVNGVDITDHERFTLTGSFNGNYQHSVLQAQLHAGVNSIVMSAVSQYGVSRVDTLTVSPASGSVPAGPTNLNALPGNGQVHLSWNAASGANSYNIYRGPLPGGESLTPIATISSGTTAYTDTGLANGTLYFYNVAAVNSVGTGPDSNEVSVTPANNVAAPIFSPMAGTYSNAQDVTITTTTSGASIRYTTDGSTPTLTTGTLYSGPVIIASTTTLQAIAYKSGLTDSTVFSATYTIDSLPPPVISSAGAAFGTVGTPFGYQIIASHSPTSYAATGLPAGLSADTSTGLISGTPSTPGTYTVTLSATNAGGTGNQALTLTVTPKAASDWDLVGAADFNGDGKPDLIWQNTVTGERTIWLMNGTTHVSSVSLGTVSTDWNIVGAADFLKNGNSDLILQNTVTGERTIWLMNGTTHVSTVSIATIPTEWDLVGAADFNGDGNSDLIWQDTVTGERAFWLMNGTTPVSSLRLITIPTEWDLVGAADFNGDGKPDLIWQDTATGQRAIWLMNGTTAVSSVSFGIVSTNWNLVGAADFNKNGNSDLILQDTTSNQCAIWLMNGTTYVSSVNFTFGLPQVAQPTFNPAGGTYTSAQSVTITSSGAAAVYFTTDGTEPTTSSTLYTTPVTIAQDTVLKAIGANSAGTSSVATAGYTFAGSSDFSLSATSVSPTVLPGESTGCTITSVPSGGFAGTVNLDVSGLPGGVTATFSPAAIDGSGHSILTIAASASALPGTYPLAIAGTCNRPSLTHSLSVTLNVNTNSSLQQAISVVSQMSLAEELAQVHGAQDGFSFRYIPASAHAPIYYFTNGPAGIGNSGSGHGGPATAMPAPISLAATFDINLAYLYGSIVGQEAVDYSNDMIEAPDINIARVPQNGRTFEAFGEDPYLVGQIAVNNIKGIQDQGISAESKHFAGNNQETSRFSINAIIDERTLREIYLPAFEATVIQGHVDAVMGAYNRVNGSFCCENMVLLHDILKGEWGFTGYTTSDFGATQSTIGSALAGLDAEMPTAIFYGTPLQDAVQSNQVSKPVLDEMLIRRFSTMIDRGVFHAPLPNQPIPGNADGAIARQIAEAGMVLLKNNGGTLPLKTSQLQSIALIGPFATSAMTGGGGSSRVHPIYTVSPLAGIQSRVAGTGITVQLNDGSNISSAAALAQNSTAAIVMVGDREAEGSDDSISLDGNQYPNQDELVQAVAAANPHTVVVLKTGTAVLMPWINQVPAVLEAWYPGEEDGNAVAAVLFGDINPSGKLPLTFPANVSDCPANTPAQYPGANETETYSEGIFVGYRHYDTSNITPLFPFGHGLSYTTFKYQNLVITPATTSFVGNPANTVNVDLDVTNTGPVAGSEVVQIYVGKPPLPNGLQDAPQWLKGFQKVTVTPGQAGHVHVVLNLRSFAFWNVTTHAWTVAPGNYSIYVGSSSRDIRLTGQVTIN